MENTRFTQGMEQLKAIDGKGGENVIKSLEDIAPDLEKFIVEFAFGDIYNRRTGNDNPIQPAYCRRVRATVRGTHQWRIECRNISRKSDRNIFAVYSIYRISKSVKCCICGQKSVCGERTYSIVKQQYSNNCHPVQNEEKGQTLQSFFLSTIFHLKPATGIYFLLMPFPLS